MILWIVFLILSAHVSETSEDLIRKCDGRGYYSLGLDDQQIFPEIKLDLVKRAQGMNITFVTSAHSDEECVELLKQLGLPFKQAA